MNFIIRDTNQIVRNHFSSDHFSSAPLISIVKQYSSELSTKEDKLFFLKLILEKTNQDKEHYDPGFTFEEFPYAEHEKAIYFINQEIAKLDKMENTEKQQSQRTSFTIHNTGTIGSLNQGETISSNTNTNNAVNNTLQTKEESIIKKVAKWIGTILTALLVAYLVYHFGWN